LPSITFAIRDYAVDWRVEVLDQAWRAAFGGKSYALRRRDKGRRAVFVLLPTEAGVPAAPLR